MTTNQSYYKQTGIKTDIDIWHISKNIIIEHTDTHYWYTRAYIDILSLSAYFTESLSQTLGHIQVQVNEIT